jgi:hypothetical protein
MHGIVTGDLIIDTVPQPGLIEVFWSGASNAPDPAQALKPFFTLLMAEAETKRARIEMHFEHLTYLNSSTVSALIRLVEGAAKAGVAMEFFYDGSLRWQEHNFKTIALLHGSKTGLRVHRLERGDAPEKIKRH